MFKEVDVLGRCYLKITDEVNVQKLALAGSINQNLTQFFYTNRALSMKTRTLYKILHSCGRYIQT